MGDSPHPLHEKRHADERHAHAEIRRERRQAVARDFKTEPLGTDVEDVRRHAVHDRRDPVDRYPGRTPNGPFLHQRHRDRARQRRAVDGPAQVHRAFRSACVCSAFDSPMMTVGVMGLRRCLRVACVEPVAKCERGLRDEEVESARLERRSSRRHRWRPGWGRTHLTRASRQASQTSAIYGEAITSVGVLPSWSPSCSTTPSAATMPAGFTRKTALCRAGGVTIL